MKKKHFLFFVFILLLSFQFSNLQAQIKWTTLDKLSSKKMTVVVIYAPWDGWSRRMDQHFIDKGIAKYANKKFNFTRLNSESRSVIKFKGETYKYDAKDGVRGRHELAKKLTNDNGTVPMLVILDENQEVVQAIPNYIEKKDFDSILKYFGEGTYKEQPWEEFEKTLNLTKTDNTEQ